MKAQGVKKEKRPAGIAPRWPFCLQCCSLVYILPNAQLSLVGFGIA